jgi:hypothetical protein
LVLCAGEIVLQYLHPGAHFLRIVVEGCIDMRAFAVRVLELRGSMLGELVGFALKHKGYDVEEYASQ